MSRQRLIKQIKEKNPQLNRSEIETIINIFCDNIRNAAKNGKKVELRNFGTFFIKTIKENHPNTSIIIYTSLPQTIYGISLLKAGAAGYLSKGVSRKVMIEAIEKVVGNGYHITTNFANELNNNIDLSRPRNAYETLSPREVEVLKLLIEGKRNIEISSSLNINQKTVNTYKTRLMRKLEVKNPVDLYQQAKNYNLA